jgi:Na+-transporting NADH:ubiquinone oxidoreductase subunit B
MVFLDRQRWTADPYADKAPHIRGVWSSDRISAALIVALLPALGVAVYAHGLATIGPVAASVAVVFFWQGVFAWWRSRPLGTDGLVTALVFALMVPVDAPLWHLALAMTFGTVVGEQIFGGRGRNFLNPAVVALAFLIFSFPSGGYAGGNAPAALASLPGAALLIAAGLISWRVVAAAAIGYVVAAYLLGAGDPAAGLAAGRFAFAVVFISADPVSAASTNPGRWIYGLMVGSLTVLGRAGAGGDGTVFAILLAQVFAPLVDQAVVLASVWLRRRRYG